MRSFFYASDFVKSRIDEPDSGYPVVPQKQVIQVLQLIHWIQLIQSPLFLLLLYCMLAILDIGHNHLN